MFEESSRSLQFAAKVFCRQRTMIDSAHVFLAPAYAHRSSPFGALIGVIMVGLGRVRWVLTPYIQHMDGRRRRSVLPTHTHECGHEIGANKNKTKRNASTKKGGDVGIGRPPRSSATDVFIHIFICTLII